MIKKKKIRLQFTELIEMVTI